MVFKDSKSKESEIGVQNIKMSIVGDNVIDSKFSFMKISTIHNSKAL